MKALILVDLQEDFMPGGPVAVPEGDRVVPVANRLMPHFDLVVATQDWHPPDHTSFASQHPGKRVGDVIDVDGLEQILWPDHCVQESRGARLHPDLDQSQLDRVIRKGTDTRIDSYSGFYDNGHRKSTGLADCLRESGVQAVAIMGLAADYCVKFTTLDAVSEGFRTMLVEDGCRGVERSPGDVQQAIAEVRSAGAEIVRAADITGSK